jgi:transcriptional regulator with XRE-family HTH domain
MTARPTCDRLSAAFARVIARFRAERGIAQDAFARALGLDPAYYRELEEAAHSLPIALIQTIADELGCTPEELIEAARIELFKSADDRG